MRRLAVCVLLAVVIAMIASAWWRGRTPDVPLEPGVTVGAGVAPRRARAVVAPASTAALAGTVRDERGPVPGVRVCVHGESGELADELLRDPACTMTDARGGYAIEHLFPASYDASAVRRGFEPASTVVPIRLRAGERRTDVDFQLRPGGLELAGSVADLTGGPIDRARVQVVGAGLQVTETDARGAFSLWVKPGVVTVRASAEGYADASEDAWIPRGALAREAARVELVLAPEASLAGIVVEAGTREPVPGARVVVGTSTFGWDDGRTTFTDAQGRFRVGKLVPKRYEVTARTSTGFGRTAGSVLVGLAQPIEDVTVELHPAFRIEGRIVEASSRADCERGALVSLQERTTNRFLDLRRATDGSHFADGVLPGTYAVTVYCPGARVRERYPPIEIVERDALGLTWEVDRGATLRGTITARGVPVEAATISVERQGAGPRERASGGTASQADGTYEVGGLAAGTYQVVVSTELQLVARTTLTVELVGTATVVRDIVLEPEDAGTIAGTIVDSDGRPVADAEITASSLAGKATAATSERTTASGGFSVGPLRPGSYRLVAFARDTALRKVGTTDDTNTGERVTVRAGQTATVQLVVEAQVGTIRGSVVDSAGAPVADAFVSAVRDSDAAGAAGSSAYQTRWSWNERPVLTTTEGTFALTGLAPGTHTIRAYRRGGGEAIAERIPLGASPRLTIRATGVIAGRVLDAQGGIPDELAITIRELATGLRRREELYRTGGRYELRDLPGGRYVVVAEARGGLAQTEVVLGDGEHRTNVELRLEARVVATGRVVELGTTMPVAGLGMSIRPVRGGGSFAASSAPERITDAAGRFTVREAPQGPVVITGWAEDGVPFDVQVFRTLRGRGTIELGDLEAIRRRLEPGQLAGSLGLRFAEQPLDTAPERRERKIAYIDPAGPAAATGLVVGDVVTAIDGVDVRGELAGRTAALLAAPPGTRVTLAVARGLTATIVLAAP